MMSILPKASIAAWTSLSGASPWVRSPENTAVSPWISLEACSATSPSRSLISTFAPCELSSSAVARPMPRADPVTIATLSSRTPMCLSPCAAWFEEGREAYSHPRRGRLEPDDLREDLAHDLVGAAADRAEAGVAGGALDVVLDHVAGAAVHLQAVVDQLVGVALGDELGHGHLLGDVLAGDEAAERVVGHGAGRVDRRRVVGQAVAQDLERADRPAERLALGDVLDRL